jgi:hypothetical protein
MIAGVTEETVCRILAHEAQREPYRGTTTHHVMVALGWFEESYKLRPNERSLDLYHRIYKQRTDLVPEICLLQGSWSGRVRRTCESSTLMSGVFNAGRHWMLRVGESVYDPATGTVRPWTGDVIQTFVTSPEQKIGTITITPGLSYFKYHNFLDFTRSME